MRKFVLIIALVLLAGCDEDENAKPNVALVCEKDGVTRTIAVYNGFRQPGYPSTWWSTGKGQGRAMNKRVYVQAPGESCWQMPANLRSSKETDQ